MDRASLVFNKAPEHKVVVIAPCIFMMDGTLCIEKDEAGMDVIVLPMNTLASFHLTKEYTK